MWYPLDLSGDQRSTSHLFVLYGSLLFHTQVTIQDRFPALFFLWFFKTVFHNDQVIRKRLILKDMTKMTIKFLTLFTWSLKQAILDPESIPIGYIQLKAFYLTYWKWRETNKEIMDKKFKRNNPERNIHLPT